MTATVPDFAALDLVATPIFVLAPDARGRPVYQHYNRHAREIAGFELEDVLGKTAREVYPSRFGEVAYGHHCRALSTGEASSYALTLPLRGHARSVKTVLAPAVDARGRVTHLVGTSEDVSARREMDDLRVHAKSLDEELAQFVSFAAHDLRSPMRKISQIAHALREEVDAENETARGLIGLLERVASQSMSLISDVLAHAQATGATESTGRFDLHTLGNAVLVMLDPLGRHELAADRNKILGDPTATQIVVRNLIDNAIKHNEGRRLRLSLRARRKDDDFFEVTVTDNGQGLSESGDALFSRGEMKIDTGYGMMGIHKLITARGGEIAAHNDAATGGAVIRFTLPGQLLS
ncbi:MAG: PAS domain-containing sensor histidine kinase [Pseudomonadota bacterium]